jgi:hypothetical protein
LFLAILFVFRFFRWVETLNSSPEAVEWLKFHSIIWNQDYWMHDTLVKSNLYVPFLEWSCFLLLFQVLSNDCIYKKSPGFRKPPIRFMVTVQYIPPESTGFWVSSTIYFNFDNTICTSQMMEHDNFWTGWR